MCLMVPIFRSFENKKKIERVVHTFLYCATSKTTDLVLLSGNDVNPSPTNFRLSLWRPLLWSQRMINKNSHNKFFNQRHTEEETYFPSYSIVFNNVQPNMQYVTWWHTKLIVWSIIYYFTFRMSPALNKNHTTIWYHNYIIGNKLYFLVT